MHLIDDDPDLPPQINILPMIDVIFSVLTFMMMGTLFLTRNEGLPVTLPQATTGEVQQQEPITISIDAQGNLALNQNPITLENLEGEVSEQIQAKGVSLVVLNADHRIDHGTVVTVMDHLRQLPGARLAIATQPPETPKP